MKAPSRSFAPLALINPAGVSVASTRPLYGASVVKRRFSFFSTLSLSPILLFGPGGAILPPRPLVPSAGARSGGQGWPAFGPPRQRRAASLTAASTTAGCVDSGATHFASLVRAFRNRAKGRGSAHRR